MTSHHITNSQLQQALLRRISQQEHLNLSDILPLLASEFHIYADQNNYVYVDLIERLMAILWDMYEIEGWIFLIRDGLIVLNRVDALDFNSHHKITINIQSRGRIFLETGFNPRSGHASVVVRDTETRVRNLVKKIVPIREVLTKKERNVKESKGLAEAIEKIALAIAGRRGQQEFRCRLISIYQHCLVTECKVQDILEAAHIRPYSENGTFLITNGLLLRSDIHTLFDLHQITFDTDENDIVILVHSDIKDINYRKYHGQLLKTPKGKDNIPDRIALREHRRKAGF